MTLSDLIADYRLLADDRGVDPFVKDSELWRIFAEAESEAAIRARLIHESDDTSICRIAVVSGRATYAMHPALYELTHISFVNEDGERSPIKLVSTEYLDGLRENPPPCPLDGYDSGTFPNDWRDATGTPALAIQTDRRLRLAPKPNIAGTIHLEGYRTPGGRLGADPEIAEAHHRHLVQWVLFRAFSIPGSEQLDPRRAALALDEFERYFGRRPDADLRRSTREDAPKRVVAHFV